MRKMASNLRHTELISECRSLFAVRCSLFAVRCSPFAVSCEPEFRMIGENLKAKG